jgi:hypothetical protein
LKIGLSEAEKYKSACEKYGIVKHFTAKSPPASDFAIFTPVLGERPWARSLGHWFVQRFIECQKL